MKQFKHLLFVLFSSSFLLGACSPSSNVIEATESSAYIEKTEESTNTELKKENDSSK